MHASVLLSGQVGRLFFAYEIEFCGNLFLFDGLTHVEAASLRQVARFFACDLDLHVARVLNALSPQR